MRVRAKDRIQSLTARILETEDPVQVQVIAAKLQVAIREYVDELHLKAASVARNQSASG
jgi:hypothetical protein